MDKLIQLLNEYKPNQWNKNLEPIGCDTYHMPCGDSIEHCIISKSYGFIDWLVDNDKIDFSKVRGIYKDKLVCGLGCAGITYVIYKKYERLLMILSIQENPIEFLISILK